MEIYEESLAVGPAGLSTGDFFRALQKISGDHCRQIGYGEPVMEAKGVMWVIVRHGAWVKRYPAPGEALRLRTWPGPTRHGMCPRYYRVESLTGELLIESCAIWSVVDRETRKMVVPATRGVEIEPLTTGLECRRPAAPGQLEETDSSSFLVPPEVLDENGHMNNTRYYDLAEERMGTEGLPLRAAIAEYVAEARLGDRLQLHWGREGGRCCIRGELTGPAFRMELQYEL